MSIHTFKRIIFILHVPGLVETEFYVHSEQLIVLCNNSGLYKFVSLPFSFWVFTTK